MLTNGRSVTCKEEANCELLPLKVYFNKDFLANVISFKQVSDMPGVKITTYTSKENAFIVPLKNGKEMKFQNCNDGLYYYDTNSSNHSKSKVNNYGVSLLNTVANNKLIFTKRQSKNTEATRHLQ